MPRELGTSRVDGIDHRRWNCALLVPPSVLIDTARAHGAAAARTVPDATCVTPDGAPTARARCAMVLPALRHRVAHGALDACGGEPTRRRLQLAPVDGATSTPIVSASVGLWVLAKRRRARSGEPERRRIAGGVPGRPRLRRAGRAVQRGRLGRRWARTGSRTMPACGANASCANELQLSRVAPDRASNVDHDAAIEAVRARPTRSCSRSTRNTDPPPRSWRPARRSCSRSTRSSTASTPSSSTSSRRCRARTTIWRT